ncbi:unnamed protein product [Parascedosporium putredinis]|uniref:ACB domain-containing protein n=1 Tax=Parascedosporium putredinis TaxID=1442378 RepID=A0A9P1M8S6_9PEZI|nr:unnamed protein product [Parascedosporium putredinis]CAI7990502.1 unnamed protein product [Parascedosporium putredinis]
MADSVDRVFVHALSTVKRIPKTGAMRPRPPTGYVSMGSTSKRWRETSTAIPATVGMRSEDLKREMDKWDAWDAQKGLTKTEAKRRYIETLISTMHRYATTGDAKELVAELEFTAEGGPMKILSPMSEQDEAELESQRISAILDDEEENEINGSVPVAGNKWARKVERALQKLSTEVAALREQITTGREWKFKKEMSWKAWFTWLFWAALQHLVMDFVVLSIVLIWLRKKKDRRLEDLVRAALKLVREYVRKIVPSR